ncbi:protein mono-ADP-ribosyltransferase TIPARP-like [Pagrus major]|uniref:protein mono-ADP-ribosyltransferase TIPARP-like n=1 Tax=Pagrus major TaxID=143350 RepID=UPI003CC83E55
MPNVSTSRGAKRKMEDNVSVTEPPSRSSKVTMLSPSLLLLEIPADINTTLPVWEAMKSQQLDIAWTVNPYSLGVHLTPAPSKQGKASIKSESTSSVAQTSAASPQPQMVIQSIAQKQSTACVMLTFTPNSTTSLPSPPGKPPKIPNPGANPTPASSLIVSLPLIITQPQPPVQPSKKVVLPAIQTPTATATQPQASSKVPVTSLFHTKISSDIQICDNFLLNICRAGKKCKMHHTPYPYHWQLWCVTSHQWVDFPPHSQVLLERMYSNANREDIFIKDGNLRFCLSFDIMEIDDPSKYDGVRRLTNSDNPVKNPYFPSTWKIYWWNNTSWEEYSKPLSTLLQKKMSEKEPECSFHIGMQVYKVDFTTMIQTNATTGFQRDIRYRPAYRSPDSMKPHLRTGIQTDRIEPVSDPPAANFNVDPLAEFSSWYPPVWSPFSEQDYSLVDVPAGTQAYQSVQGLFYESLPEIEVDLVSIQQVQNLLHWDKYQRHKAYMQKQHTKSKEPLERHLFHGTTKEASEEICHNNFDPRMAGVNGTSYGFGSYFAITASFSNGYTATAHQDDVRHMFLAKVLVGTVSVGKNNLRRPPPIISKTRQYRLYDTCVDNVNKPTMFVVFDSCQCYPYYLIKYKDLPQEIDI